MVPRHLESSGRDRPVKISAWGSALTGFPGGSEIKNLPGQETRVQSRGQESPLEKEAATHASILACKIPWTEEPGGLLGSQRVRHS